MNRSQAEAAVEAPKPAPHVDEKAR